MPKFYVTKGSYSIHPGRRFDYTRIVPVDDKKYSKLGVCAKVVDTLPDLPHIHKVMKEYNSYYTENITRVGEHDAPCFPCVDYGYITARSDEYVYHNLDRIPNV